MVRLCKLYHKRLTITGSLPHWTPIETSQPDGVVEEPLLPRKEEFLDAMLSLARGTASGLSPAQVPERPPNNVQAPWLTTQELRHYLPPLLATDWGLYWEKNYCRFHLAGNFPAKSYGRAMRLMRDIDRIASDENVRGRVNAHELCY